ncbi:TPA: hypothetical protein ACH3X1_000816 [Trebouxia sp. C0004]
MAGKYTYRRNVSVLTFSRIFATQSLINAYGLAYSTGVEVQHPLLDKLWLCSANPDQAASFFLHLFHPVPYKRIAAVDHARTASTVSRTHDERA